MTNIQLTDKAIQKAIWSLENFVILFIFFVIFTNKRSEIQYLQINF